MCEQDNNGIQNIIKWNRVFEETAPGSHVGRKEIRFNGIKNSYVQTSDDGKNDDDRHRCNNRPYGILCKG